MLYLLTARTVAIYIRNAHTPFTPRGGQIIYSILDIELQDGFILYVFPGALSPNDIWLKYRKRDSRVRTPKHIHWAVDILIKKFLNQEKTYALLQVFQQYWEDVGGLPARDADSIVNSLSIAQNPQLLMQFEPLNSSGFFRIDFLLHLMELLMLQEKTNKPDAYMFKQVLDGLLNSSDLYKIISTVTHNGR